MQEDWLLLQRSGDKMSNIEQAVAEILTLLLGQKVTPDGNIDMSTCKAWDSLKHIEIIMTVEERLRISFEAEDIPRLTSQALIVARIKEMQNA